MDFDETTYTCSSCKDEELPVELMKIGPDGSPICLVCQFELDDGTED